MSNIIDSIQLSGSSYDVRDKSATTVVEITQSDYDNLPSSAKTSNIIYIITDGSVDYITSAQCQTQIDNSISGKQDTLVSGTNIKTINNESLLGSGNIDIQGGGSSMTIDPTLDSGSTNPVANSAITTSVNEKQFKRRYVGCDNGDAVFLSTDSVVVDGKIVTIMKPMFRGYANNSTNTGLEMQNVNLGLYFTTINGKNIFGTSKNSNWITEVIETSAITTSVTSSSTDTQVPSAKAVNDKLGGLSLVKLTQAEYDALATKDSNTLYVIVN